HSLSPRYLRSRVLYCYTSLLLFSFFSHATPPPAFYPLSLHDALPISRFHPILSFSPQFAHSPGTRPASCAIRSPVWSSRRRRPSDRKSTRLNSSHVSISYAVFCLKKKKKKNEIEKQDKICV